MTRAFDEASGEPLLGDWTYSGARNSITFLEFIPDELSKIEIHYTVQSSVVDGTDVVTE